MHTAEKHYFCIKIRSHHVIVSLRSKALRGHILTRISGWTSGGIPGVLFLTVAQSDENDYLCRYKKLNPIA